MDLWDHQLQLQDDRHRGRHRRQNPSFSSSLLDAVYRSIDDSNAAVIAEEHTILYRSNKKNQIEEQQGDDRSKNFVVRRTSMADFDRTARNVRDRDDYRKFMSSSSNSTESRNNAVRDRDDYRKLTNSSSSESRNDCKKLMNSSSSSSESSSGGGFSSSESESRSTSSSSSSYKLQKPRPIRTDQRSQFGDGIKIAISNNNNQKPKHENSFTKTKSKALKIYGDLKKVKQPISPGGRLASFLNSIFNGGTPKKQQISESKSSTCSSASSFSRSCLSKTQSNNEKLINNNGGAKRSVRFCPVSVILDEDSRPCGHMSLRDVLRNSGHCRAEEGCGDLMKLYEKKINGDLYMNRDESEEDDDDDDAVSCSSSDLFELDNLSSIGIERYCEELPVYETTHFSTNRAIANGLIL